MSDWVKPLITNFAGTAYREAAVAVDNFGADSVRTKTLTEEAMLRTKGGMPRVYPLKKHKCKNIAFPLNEIAYEERVLYTDEDDPQDMKWRLWSYDGLYSLGRNKLNSLRVSDGATPFRIVLAPDESGTVGPNGDFVDTGRTLLTAETHVALVTNERALSFMMKPMESIALTKLSCTGLNATLNLGCTGSKGAAPAAYGEVFGAYSVSSVDCAYGPVKAVYGNGKDGGMLITFAGDGGFIEHLGAEPLKEIPPDSWFVKGDDEWAAANGNYGAAGWFPRIAQFSASFRGFLTPQGMFTDEGMTVELKAAEAGINAPLTFPTAVSVDQDLAPRYFNFTGGKEDADIGETALKMRHDIQFNKGCCSPSVEIQSELSRHHHLYKDPDGAVWLIRVMGYTNSRTYAETVSALVTLERRFDPIYEPSKTTNINRELCSLDAPSGYWPYAAYPGYLNRKAPFATPSFVESLPDGSACALHCIERHSSYVQRFRHPLGEANVTHGIFIVRFSGSGGTDGSGITATIESVPVIRAWNEVATQKYASSQLSQRGLVEEYGAVAGEFNIRTFVFSDTTDFTLQATPPQHVLEVPGGIYVEPWSYSKETSGTSSRATGALSVDWSNNPECLVGEEVSQSVEILVRLVPTKTNTFEKVLLTSEYSRRLYGGDVPTGSLTYKADARSTVRRAGGFSNDYSSHSWKTSSLAERTIDEEYSLKYASDEGESKLSGGMTYVFSERHELDYTVVNEHTGTVGGSTSSNIEYGDESGTTTSMVKTRTWCGSRYRESEIVNGVKTTKGNWGYNMYNSPEAPGNDTGLLEFAPVFIYGETDLGERMRDWPDFVLWNKFPVKPEYTAELRCLDPRNDRLYVAPEPNAAGLFF